MAKIKLSQFTTLRYGKGLPEDQRTTGLVPVYGSNGIVGFHKESFVKGPVIVLGRKGSIGAVHFSTKDCWPIDTTFFIDDVQGNDLKFVYFLLKLLPLKTLNSDTSVPGINRNLLGDVEVSLPVLENQKKISYTLSTLQRRIELLDKQIESYKALKQSMMQKLFTEGLRGEKQKVTEIGLMPESWKIIKIADVVEFT